MAGEIDRQYLYQLIVSQLHHDGYSGLASAISSATLTPFDDSIPKGELESLVQAGMEAQTRAAPSARHIVAASSIQGIDFDQEVGATGRSTLRSNFETHFIATHRLGCTKAAFSPDGAFAATGSQDNTIKLIDVNKITSGQGKDDSSSIRAVIKTLYDHTHRISGLDFHPHLPILATSSETTVKFYDLKEVNKKVKKEMKDTHNIRCLKFHPCGDFVLIGTDHHYIRLYDYSTRNSYISPASEQQSQHQLPVNDVDVMYDGRVFVSCSEDGSIKLWDGRTLSCINTFDKAHSGAAVFGSKFSRNGKYLLSSGEDYVVRLWDVAAAKPIFAFDKIISKFRCPATFSYDEKLIILPDESNGALVFDTLTHQLTQQLTGHSNGIRCIASSPVDSTLITGSEDARARFWVNIQGMD